MRRRSKIGKLDAVLGIGTLLIVCAGMVQCTRADQGPGHHEAEMIKVGGTRLYHACVGGYSFVVQRGKPTQILDESGHGVRCEG